MAWKAAATKRHFLSGDKSVSLEPKFCQLRRCESHVAVPDVRERQPPRPLGGARERVPDGERVWYHAEILSIAIHSASACCAANLADAPRTGTGWLVERRHNRTWLKRLQRSFVATKFLRVVFNFIFIFKGLKKRVSACIPVTMSKDTHLISSRLWNNSDLLCHKRVFRVSRKEHFQPVSFHGRCGVQLNRVFNAKDAPLFFRVVIFVTLTFFLKLL